MALEFLNDAYFAAKVGIGTSSPQAPLSFLADVGPKIDFYHNTGCLLYTSDAADE